MSKKTKLDLIYTIIGVAIMVPIMTTYNKYLVFKDFMDLPLTTGAFWFAVLIGICQRLPVVFPLQFFLVQKYAERKTAEHTRPDEDVYIKMAVRTAFSILILCPVLSLYSNLILVFDGTVTSFPAFLNNWIPKLVVNFPFAYMIQVFVAGPLNLHVFRIVMRHFGKK